jgi:4-alpha-glucanotransferase
VARSNVAALRRLARAYGVQTSYFGLGGRRHQATPEALVAVLRALGADLPTIDASARELTRRERDRLEQPIEPVLVLDLGQPATFDLRLQSLGQSPSLIQCSLHLEAGTEHAWTARWDQAPLIERVELGPTAFEVRRLDIPHALTIGYHQLTVTAPHIAATALLIVPPHRAFVPHRRQRDWGLFAPLYALHSERSWGAGDLQDLDQLVELTSALGGRAVGTTPLLATFDAEPAEPSPYSPVSKLFWNEIYLDLKEVLASSSTLPRPELSPNALQEIAALRQTDLIDYDALLRLRRSVVAPLAHAFFAAPPAVRRDFDAYTASNPLVRDYARFRAEQAPPSEASAIHDYHLFVQWQLHQQMSAARSTAEARGVALYFDLPVGVRRDGFDPWCEPDLFAAGASIGAPPDSGFPTGQNWELPPILPDASRRQGHSYFRATIRHQLNVASMLRIDHVMGLHRLFWIPPGGDSSDGVYVQYPAEEYHAILKIESHRHRAIIVGEDLGIVPREVRSAMGRHALQRLHVIEIDLLEQDTVLSDPPTSAVASLNTHDMPPFASFFTRADGHELWMRLVNGLREQGLLGGDPDLPATLSACYRFLAQSDARLVLANLEDLWLETAPQNVPGPDVGNPNWRRKLRHSLEEIRSLASARELLEILNEARGEP